MSSFKNMLSARVIEFNGELEKVFQQNLDTPEVIIDAMRYSLFAGGKRLRPILMMETCRALEGDLEAIKPLAMGIEMIHTYSLIHDDLPAMDNDDLRRGKPTNHKVYGDAMAILAGDGLLNYAVETMLAGTQGLTGDGLINYLNAMKSIMGASGVLGMIGGQVADMLSEDKVIGLDEMDYIHLHKTAALLEACVQSGCLIAGAEPATQGRLISYSHRIGLAFQIVDDILDIEGTEADLGKPIGSDEKNNKSTFVSLYGLEASKLRVDELETEAIEMLKPIGERTVFLQELARYICRRQK
ncbi:polyprenyl synthetase family protein [Acetobacterium carbinolicum]|uniref:polyprenyl synthetase family protein n=1 Tax=Acetobacterium TaxID=33951 RepID=UPI00195507CB|nr:MULTISPECIES: farnesyl diphosphate synthase [unclassified Acetobacterium]MDK2940509.1 geranylgeranyl diphosphate synthase, type [Acetobacterium sp.]MDZ5724962.1 farnesyl diphosphate synthase [Acetobacterium sp. K1/6]